MFFLVALFKKHEYNWVSTIVVLYAQQNIGLHQEQNPFMYLNVQQMTGCETQKKK